MKDIQVLGSNDPIEKARKNEINALYKRVIAAIHRKGGMTASMKARLRMIVGQLKDNDIEGINRLDNLADELSVYPRDEIADISGGESSQMEYGQGRVLDDYEGGMDDFGDSVGVVSTSDAFREIPDIHAYRPPGQYTGYADDDEYSEYNFSTPQSPGNAPYELRIDEGPRSNLTPNSLRPSNLDTRRPFDRHHIKVMQKEDTTIRKVEPIHSSSVKKANVFGDLSGLDDLGRIFPPMSKKQIRGGAGQLRIISVDGVDTYPEFQVPATSIRRRRAMLGGPRSKWIEPYAPNTTRFTNETIGDIGRLNPFKVARRVVRRKKKVVRRVTHRALTKARSAKRRRDATVRRVAKDIEKHKIIKAVAHRVASKARAKRRQSIRVAKRMKKTARKEAKAVMKAGVKDALEVSGVTAKAREVRNYMLIGGAVAGGILIMGTMYFLTKRR